MEVRRLPAVRPGKETQLWVARGRRAGGGWSGRRGAGREDEGSDQAGRVTRAGQIERRAGGARENAGKGKRIVWLWQSEVQPDDRVAIAECPVSYVTGESAALLEDFYAHRALGGTPEVLAWPARRVDAFVALRTEQAKVEREAHGQR
jgi:hypothetical protein